MAELYENQDLEEKVLLLGVSTQEEDMEASLDEMAELADTAGARDSEPGVCASGHLHREG